MSIKVIIIQTSESGFGFMEDLLGEVNLLDDPRIILLRSFADEEIKSVVRDGGHQLFVTGSIRGNEQKAIHLIGELKSLNSRLVCCIFSTENFVDVGDADLFLQKTLSEKDFGQTRTRLIHLINSFLQED